jgi:hypothetical protein
MNVVERLFLGLIRNFEKMRNPRVRIPPNDQGELIKT